MYPPHPQFETLDAEARRRAVHVRELELARSDGSAPERGARRRRVKVVLLRSLASSR